MAALKITVASIVEIAGALTEDYYTIVESNEDTQADTGSRRTMIEATILIIILTSWMVYLYTVTVEQKSKTSTTVIRKEVTEVYIQTEKVYKEPDLKDTGAQTENKRIRTVSTQSQCKYTYWCATPRFTPLPDDSHGAFSEVYEDEAGRQHFRGAYT